MKKLFLLLACAVAVACQAELDENQPAKSQFVESYEVVIEEVNEPLAEEQMKAILGPLEIVGPTTKGPVYWIDTTEEMIELVTASPYVVIINWWAAWCGPCRIMSNLITNTSLYYEDKDCLFGRANIDELADVAQKYGIRALPTTWIIRNCVLEVEIIGIVDEYKLKDLINRYIW